MSDLHIGNTGTFTVLVSMKKDSSIVTRSYGPYTKTKARNLEKHLKAKHAEDESIVHFEISQLWTAAWWGDKDELV